MIPGIKSNWHQVYSHIGQTIELPNTETHGFLLPTFFIQPVCKDFFLALEMFATKIACIISIKISYLLIYALWMYVIDYNQIWIDTVRFITLMVFIFKYIKCREYIVCEYRRAKYVYFTIK